MRVQDRRVWGLGFEVRGFVFRVKGLVFTVPSPTRRATVSVSVWAGRFQDAARKYLLQCLGFRVQGLGCRV